jgi:mannose-1-phosphate guanylyltransferase
MKKKLNKIAVIIMCGGSGSRLWPISREDNSKPFLKLAYQKFSLFQQSVLLAKNCKLVSDIYIVSNISYSNNINIDIAELKLKLSSTSLHYIYEPSVRNTSAAIACSANLIASQHDENTTLVVMPADHMIRNQSNFYSDILKAQQISNKGKLVTFGIKPLHAETGYGYIEYKDFDVIKFHEKPGIKKATEYLNSGNHLWNSGIFCFNIKTFFSELRNTAPEVYKSSQICFLSSIQELSDGILNLNNRYFDKIPAISIDFSLMEKSKNVAVIPASFEWSDIGSWFSVESLYVDYKDENKNIKLGDVFYHNSNNCFINSNDRFVAAIGLSNLIIIDSKDALLVIDKEKAQDVKSAFEYLKKNNTKKIKTSSKVKRPWGLFEVVDEGPGYKIKKIIINQNSSISYQTHNKRAEHWVVVSGIADVRKGDEYIVLIENQSIFIPANTPHQLINKQKSKLIIIEVQTGTYLEESDIIRIEDPYKRY